MKSVCVAQRAMLERKPPHGQPCNQCGLCCYAAPCALGAALFATRAGPCPALRFHDNGDSYCDVVAHPEQYSATARRAPQSMRLAALPSFARATAATAALTANRAMKLLTRGSTPRTIRVCARKRGICGPYRKINRPATLHRRRLTVLDTLLD